MKIKFNYDNEKRIKQGLEPIYKPGEVEVPVAEQSDAVREEMARMNANSLPLQCLELIGYTSRIGNYYIESNAHIIDGTAEEIIAILENNILVRQEAGEWAKQRIAEKEIEAIAEVRAWIAMPIEKKLRENSFRYGVWEMGTVPNPVSSLAGEHARALAETEAEIARRNAEYKEKIAAAEKEEEARQAAFPIIIAAMLREHGTASQVERYKAGVLPWSEIKTVVRMLLMGKLDEAGFLHYEQIGDAVDHAEYCPGEEAGCEVHYTADDMATLNAGQWEAVKCARELAPDCTVTPVLHRAWASCNENVETQRPALRVEGELHGIKVSRSYALTDNAELITEAANLEARR